MKCEGTLEYCNLSVRELKDFYLKVLEIMEFLIKTKGE